MKFFLYQLLGSMLLLAGILFLYVHHHAVTGIFTFSISELYKTAPLIPFYSAIWVFAALVAGFAIRIPMFPFHTWLPDAYEAAPAAVSITLAGVLLNTGVYGCVRFLLPLFPSLASDPRVEAWMIGLSLLAIIYGALICFGQKDMKIFLAYFSMSQLGFCTLGLFLLSPLGLTGSLLQQMSRGVSISALFLIVAILDQRRQTSEIREYGGIAKVMPVCATIAMVMFLAATGLPLLYAVVSQHSFVKGGYTLNWKLVALLALGAMLTVACLADLYQRVFRGSLNAKNEKLRDLTTQESFLFVPLVVVVLWIAVYPRPFVQILERPVNEIMQTIHGGPILH
jgi:NADH-quinone oxidoreductase subunit M